MPVNFLLASAIIGIVGIIVHIKLDEQARDHQAGLQPRFSRLCRIR